MDNTILVIQWCNTNKYLKIILKYFNIFKLCIDLVLIFSLSNNQNKTLCNTYPTFF